MSSFKEGLDRSKFTPHPQAMVRALVYAMMVCFVIFGLWRWWYNAAISLVAMFIYGSFLEFLWDGNGMELRGSELHDVAAALSPFAT